MDADRDLFLAHAAGMDAEAASLEAQLAEQGSRDSRANR
jgi:hypothetical protein